MVSPRDIVVGLALFYLINKYVQSKDRVALTEQEKMKAAQKKIERRAKDFAGSGGDLTTVDSWREVVKERGLKPAVREGTGSLKTEMALLEDQVISSANKSILRRTPPEVSETAGVGKNAGYRQQQLVDFYHSRTAMRLPAVDGE